jgi:hypothetical protein
MMDVITVTLKKSELWLIQAALRAEHTKAIVDKEMSLSLKTQLNQDFQELRKKLHAADVDSVKVQPTPEPQLAPVDVSKARWN